MEQETTESKEFYATEHFSLRGVLESTAAFEKEIKLDDPLRPLPTNKISLFCETSVTPNQKRITTSQFSTIFQSASHSEYFSLDAVQIKFLTALTLLRQCFEFICQSR